MKIIHLILFVFTANFGFMNVSYGQVKDSFELDFEAKYKENIEKSRINGVYIPKNLEEVFNEIKGLADEESIEKFKNGQEEVVVKKLHFGLGRWMIYNWNFYAGSRLSHLIKEKGVSHPDDMAKFLLTIFHRHLNNKELEESTLILELAEARKKLLEKNQKVILDTIIIKKDTTERQ